MSFRAEGRANRFRNHWIRAAIGTAAAIAGILTFIIIMLNVQTSNTGTSDSQTVVQNVNCGQVVSSNVVLTSNMDCRSSDGIIIGKDNLTIDLHGFSIIGPDANNAIKDSSKVGISVPKAKNIVIKNGEITGFQAGILISGSSNVLIQDVIPAANGIGIFTTNSSTVKINMNDIRNNKIGVAFHSSTGTEVHGNNMTDNYMAGITLVNTESSRVDANSIRGSVNAIYRDSQSSRNTIVINNVVQNLQNNLDKSKALINELVKTGKFTEDEAKDFVSKTMQQDDNGGDTENVHGNKSVGNDKINEGDG